MMKFAWRNQDIYLSLLLFVSHWTKSHCGTCWFAVGDEGNCHYFDKTVMSQEECCSQSSSGRMFRGWTEQDNPSSGDLFHWLALGVGAPNCHSCHVNCDGVDCAPDRRCRMRHGRPRCVCDPDCSKLSHRHHGPICGTDRRTYRNHCSLIKHNCRRNDNVEINFNGRCLSSCESVSCDEGKHCVMDQHGLPHCIRCMECVAAVRDSSQQVCGTNDVTYPTTCHLLRQACLQGSSIGMAYNGACSDEVTCRTLTCPRSKRCLTQPDTGRPRCVTCGGHCHDPAGSPTVCGTDGNTYTGHCQLREFACHTGAAIETKHSGDCPGQSSYLLDIRSGTSDGK